MSDLEAFDKEWREGDRAKAVEMAKAYVDATREEMTLRFGALTLGQMVKEVEFYRSEGRREDMLKAKAWLRSEFEPQKIGGALTIGGGNRRR